MINLAQAMRLYLITDDKARSPADLADRVSRGIDGGATAVQFREKNGGITMCARAFTLIAKRCEEAHVPLFINADLIGRFTPEGIYAGYHYSDRTLPPHASPGSRIAGYSAHAPEDAEYAASHGANFFTLSPIFPTPSKSGILDAIGIEAITQCRQLLPDGVIVALGGIDETNSQACLRAGASGIAVIRAIMAAEDPRAAAKRLRAIIENYTKS